MPAIVQKRTKIDSRPIGSRTKIHPSSAFEVGSSTLGSRPYPRLTTVQINAIVTPDEGLMAWDLTLHALKVFDGTAWKTLAFAA